MKIFGVVLISFTLGLAVGVSLILPNVPSEIFCESGTEITLDKQYELWQAECNQDSVYGRKVLVTMID